MLKFSILILIILIQTISFAENNKKTESEYNELVKLLDQRSSEIEKDFEKNNEEALNSITMDEKNKPLFERVSKFQKENPQYKNKFNSQVERMNSILDKVNERHAKELKEISNKKFKKCGRSGAEIISLSFELAEEFKKSKDKKIIVGYKEKILQKAKEMDDLIREKPECNDELKAAFQEAKFQMKDVPFDISIESNSLISYDEWYTLSKTGTKSGKKYSFAACVNGAKNATAVNCVSSGSAAKRIFYSMDDIENPEVKREWVNTINEMKCVTAYITGEEAFIVDLKAQYECK